MVTAVEDQGGFAVETFRHQLFQFRISGKVTGQQSRRRGGEGVFLFLPFFQESLLKVGAGSQTQVVVGRQVKHYLPVFLYPVAVMRYRR